MYVTFQKIIPIQPRILFYEYVIYKEIIVWLVFLLFLRIFENFCLQHQMYVSAAQERTSFPPMIIVHSENRKEKLAGGIFIQMIIIGMRVSAKVRIKRTWRLISCTDRSS